MRNHFLVEPIRLHHHSKMDYIGFVQIIIATTPFLVWGMIILVLSNIEPSTKAKKPERELATNNENIADISIIPYGLIFPLYYRSSAPHNNLG